jgi:nitronate monooxygenase
VNQIVHRSNARLEHDLELCVRHKVPIVITSLGAREEVNQAVHSYGGIVLHDVIDNRFARKAIEKARTAWSPSRRARAGTRAPCRPSR